MLFGLGRTALAVTVLLALPALAVGEPRRGSYQSDSGAAPEPSKGASRRAAPVVDDPRSIDIAYWSAIKDTTDCETVRTYLDRFPQGLFVEVAKISERRLCTPAPQPVSAPAVLKVEPEPAVPSPAPVPALVTPPAEPAAALPAPPATPPSPTAAITPSVASPPPQAEAPFVPIPSLPEPANQDTIRLVQAELLRVGCSTARPTGKWTPTSQAAMERFNRFGLSFLDASQPTKEFVATLGRHTGRVCPLECAAGEVKQRSGVCVAAALPSLRAPRTPRTLATVPAAAATTAAGAPAAERAASPSRRITPTRQDPVAAAATTAPASIEQPASTKRRITPTRHEPVASPAAAERSVAAERGRLNGSTRRERAANRASEGAVDARGCRHVPRPTGGSYQGDTVEVCN